MRPGFPRVYRLRRSCRRGSQCLGIGFIILSALRLYSRSTGQDLTLPTGLETDAEFDDRFEQPQPPTTTE